MNRNRIQIAWCLSALVIVVYSSTAAAQGRRADESVARAPDIVILQPSVQGNVSVSCALSHLGPETVETTTNTASALGGMVQLTSSRTDLRLVASSDCSGWGDGYRQAMQATIDRALNSVSRSAQWSEGGGELLVNVELTPTVAITHAGERTDGEGDSTCANLCGTSSCQIYSLELAIGESVTLTAPPYEGAPQQFSAAYPNNYSSMEFFACNHGQAGSKHGELVTDAMWQQAFQRLQGEISSYLSPVLGQSNGTFSARVSNVRRARSADAAFDAFERGNYADAMQGFLNAYREDGSRLNESNQADLLYNAGLSALFAGDFSIAREHAEAAYAIDSDRRIVDLLDEIATRESDLEVFTALGLPDPY